MHDKTSSAVSISSHLSHLQSVRSHRLHRDNKRLFVIEGIRQFVQASDAKFEFDSLFVSPALLRHGLAQKLVRRLVAQGTPRIVLSPEQFRRASRAEHASGIIAIVRQRWTALDAVDPPRGLGWLVIEHLRSAGNLGTIFRTAHATGMSGVIFAGPACDPYDSAAVRASMGSLFHVPLVRATPRELGFWLAKHNVQTIALSPTATRIWTELAPAPARAIVLGEEREGLSPGMRRLCDCEVRLPMPGHVDSLNVAVAAGVMMYELVRRQTPPQGPAMRK